MISNKKALYKPVVKGEIELIEEKDGFRLKVGKKGGSVRLDLERGELLREKMTEDKFIIIPLRYDAIHSYYFHFAFRTGEGKSVQAHFATLPFMDVDVAFPLSFLNLETVFMKRTPGRLKNMMHGTPIKASEVTALELTVPESAYECEVIFGHPYLTDKEPDSDINVLPQIDSMGQWKMKEWDFKMKSEEEMIAYLQEELIRDFEAFPCERSKFGGELSMKREGTGYFRIHKEDGVYWFCDPQGYLLFSHGMDIIHPHEFCPYNGLEVLFDEIPKEEGLYKAAFNHWNGQDSISFHSLNLMKAFGEDWHKKWEELTLKRLKAFGFNTVANWAEEGFGSRHKMSYVAQGAFPSTKKTLFRSMPDVFSKEYQESARECAKWLLPYKEDPYMIGYFMRNEPDWAFGEYNITEIMLSKEEPFVSKEIFITEMVRKYVTIEGLNNAWGVDFEEFSDLMKPIVEASKLSPEAKIDTEYFTKRIIREYVRVPAESYKAVDPNHLNLGLRYGWLATDNLVEGCEYCDVFSMNYYKEAPLKEEFDRIHAMTNLPILIGEFQVGSLEGGMMSNSMFGTRTQEGRGVFYQYYLEQAATLPYMLGAHAFQWNDQPTLGRFDGENVNIGIVDVCNRPYEGYIKGMKNAHQRVARIHAKEIEATTVRSEIMPREGF